MKSFSGGGIAGQLDEVEAKASVGAVGWRGKTFSGICVDPDIEGFCIAY